MTIGVMVLGGSVGCTTPPAVGPLLRATAAAIEDEATHIETDRQRLAAATQQTLDSLEAGFVADLDAADELDRQWVLDAVRVYAAAREAVVLHERGARAAFDDRQQNLRLAAAAQRQALALLERQDRLIIETTGVDLWRWVTGRPTAAP